MFPMKLNPIAFAIGGLEVHWYGIILGTGALVGLLLAIREGKRFGLSPDFFLDLMLYGVPSAIVAARLYYVIFKWDYYRANPSEIVQIWHGGIAIYGALIGAFICGFIFIRNRGYSFWRIADICAPSLLVGQMIGRWGNFVNQEAYGGPVDESFLRHTLHLPAFIVDQMNVEGTYHHPTFLYESLWSLIGVVLLLILRRQPFMRAGEMLFSYAIWYSVGRFFVEGLRTDSLAFHGPGWLASVLNALWSPMSLLFGPQGYLDPNYGNIRSSQLLAMLLVLFSVAAIVVRRRMGWAAERYADPLVRREPALAAASAETAADRDPEPDVAEGADGPAAEPDAQTEGGDAGDPASKDNNHEQDHNRTV